MPRRRSGRFALEALFLAGVAVAVTVAELRPAGVIVLMALAWVIVALLEWTAWLDEPHYGRGLPPRFYVPQVALPPPRQVEQAGRYPVILEADDESTFVTAASEWAAGLEPWPVLDVSPVDEETQIAIPDEEFDDGFAFDEEPGPGLGVEPRFPPEREPAPRVELTPVPEAPAVEPQSLPESEPEPPGEDGAAEEALVAQAPPVEEVPAPGVAEPAVELPAPAAELPAPVVEAPVAAPEPARPQLAPLERVAAVAVHHVDPLTSSGRRRLFRRAAAAAVVEVPDGPPPGRMLPGRAAATSRAGET